MNISNIGYCISLFANAGVAYTLFVNNPEREVKKTTLTLLAISISSLIVGHTFSPPPECMMQLKILSVIPTPEYQCSDGLKIVKEWQNRCGHTACGLGKIAERFFALNKTCENFFHWTFSAVEKGGKLETSTIPVAPLLQKITWGLSLNKTEAFLMENNVTTGFNITLNRIARFV